MGDRQTFFLNQKYKYFVDTFLFFIYTPVPFLLYFWHGWLVGLVLSILKNSVRKKKIYLIEILNEHQLVARLGAVLFQN